jgi:hypothetical protein
MSLENERRIYECEQMRQAAVQYVKELKAFKPDTFHLTDEWHQAVAFQRKMERKIRAIRMEDDAGKKT